MTDPAACAATSRPTAVEPVKETMAMSGCVTSACPATGPLPVTMLMTPSGMPASWAAFANIIEVSGVSSDGIALVTGESCKRPAHHNKGAKPERGPEC